MISYATMKGENLPAGICRNMIKGIFLLLFVLNLIPSYSQYLKRSVTTTPVVKMELSTPTAKYKAMFGFGDDNSASVNGVNRYGLLSIDSAGISNTVKYPDEELVLFILEGTGNLICEKDKVPVSKNDFIYIPADLTFGFSNPRERPLSVLLMGFTILSDNPVKPATKLMIANADQVKFQELASHGPTTLFQLLMGTTDSKRDRLAAACQVTSLFIMDFLPGGTNIPHQHAREEEIYFILQGNGDIVAGKTLEGKEFRHPSRAGDAYFFDAKTLIGFYSGNKEGEEHAKILAVRFTIP